MARLDQDCKKSLVFRFMIDTLVYKESQRQSETAGATAEEAQVDLKEESNKKNTNIFEDSTDCTVW